MNIKNREFIDEKFHLLKEYCEGENFKGWDPYDGLNSRLFNRLKLNEIKLFRLFWIQLFKHNPINLRNLVGIDKEYNPKGLALFLSAYCNIYSIEKNSKDLEKIIFLADKILILQTVGYSGSCWGYNFDWQSRAFFLPKKTPTIVVTSFVANALLDAYEVTKEKRYLDASVSSSKFILYDLNHTNKERGFIFSYSPYDNTAVYNASLLGSKLLARIYHYTKNEILLETARNSIQACVDAQNSDGSWVYGELPIQNWIDSFHTGYNIEAIATYQHYSKDMRFEKSIEKGLEFYIKNLFLCNGIPKYYHDRVYPLDIHSPAQFIVTLYRTGTLKKNIYLVEQVLRWTIDNMQDPKGYFYYQQKSFMRSNIPYMRWSEAWMFYGLSFYLKCYYDSITNINNINIYNFKTREEFLTTIENQKKILIAINAEKIMIDNKQLRDIINNNIGYPDGISTVSILKDKGKEAIKIPGSEFWLDIIKHFKKTRTFFLIGSTTKVIERTVKKIKKEYPDINIIGYHNGYIDENQKESLKELISSKKPDIIFVAQGSPRQEILMDELFSIHPAIYMGLGGSFDIYVGDKKRAPKLFLELNLEWLFRLFQEPTRFYRQLNLIKFVLNRKRL